MPAYYMAQFCAFWIHLRYVFQRIVYIDQFDKCHSVNGNYARHKADVLQHPAGCTRDSWSDTLMCNDCFYPLYMKK